MRLDDLFIVKNGITSNEVEVLHYQEQGTIPFIRPASTQQRTLSGWVRKSSVQPANVYPAYTIFVSTNGEGSHTYSYVSRFAFVPNSDVSVLIPKRRLSLGEKIYYARCITMNRFKYSYGRKPKGERLKCLQLPNKVPKWTKALKVPTNIENGLRNLAMLSSRAPKNSLKTIGTTFVEIKDLFHISYGHSLELNRLEKNPLGINFVARTSKNNGITARVKLIKDVMPAEAGLITVAVSGSVLESFVQVAPFYTAFHVMLLRPKEPMVLEEKLFYCACLKENQFCYSYGRQANRTLKGIKIPSKESIPKWVYGSLKQIAADISKQMKI